MTVMHVVRKGLAVAVAAGTGLAVAAAGITSAALASGRPHAARPAALSIAGHVVLTGATSASRYTETPDGTVYYTAGSAVYVVHGTSTPTLAFHAGGQVLAIAANKADVLVTVNKTVTEYTRSGGAKVRQWTLFGRHKLTIAGLYVVGGTVWAWTDWLTDQTGLEYANVYRFSTSAPTVHMVSANNAYPYDAAADAAGFYYEAIRANGTNGYLVRVTPSGVIHRVTDIHLSGSLALAGGRVEILAERFNKPAGLYVDSYSQATLMHAYSRRVNAGYFGLAGTGAGLLAIHTLGKVSVLSATSGAVVMSVTVPGASALLSGPSAAVITVSGATFTLVRLA